MNLKLEMGSEANRIFYAHFQEGSTFRNVINVLKSSVTSTNLLFTKDIIYLYEGKPDKNVTYNWIILATARLLKYQYNSIEVQKSIKSRRSRKSVKKYESDQESDSDIPNLIFESETGQEAMPVGISLEDFIKSTSRVKVDDGFEIYMESDDNKLSIHRVTDDMVKNNSPVHRIDTFEIDIESPSEDVYEKEGFKMTVSQFCEHLQEASKRQVSSFAIMYDLINQQIYFGGTDSMHNYQFSNLPPSVDESQLRVFYIDKSDFKGWPKIKKITQKGDLIKFYVEDLKPLKIEIPSGTYGTFNIMIRQQNFNFNPNEKEKSRSSSKQTKKKQNNK
jgi:hypothetical protein